MKDWFSTFAESLKGADPSRDLVGGGTASIESAIEHYRFQHRTKIFSAVTETFPILVKELGDEWEILWNKFVDQNSLSMRSLDYYAKVFLDYFLSTNASIQLKELAVFEEAIDSYAWSHGRQPALTMTLFGEDAKLQIGEYKILRFTTHVTSLYEQLDEKSFLGQNLILWHKDDRLCYRELQEWEISILELLPTGIDHALENCEAQSEEVQEFFLWLGTSYLIRKIL